MPTTTTRPLPDTYFKLVRRFPNIRLVSNNLRWRPAPVLRGLESLPVKL